MVPTRVALARANLVAASLGAATATLLTLSGSAFSQQASINAYPYLSPSPGSRFVSPQNNVVFREGRALDPASVTPGLVAVVGAVSGPHDGSLVVASDGRTLVFRPSIPFTLGETVEVALQAGLRANDGSELPPVEFGFEIGMVNPRDQLPLLAQIEEYGGGAGSTPPEPAGTEATCTDLPTGFPPFNISVYNNPDPGYLFLSPFAGRSGGNIAIIDNVGQPLFFQHFPRTIHDFSAKPNGLLVYFETAPASGMPKYFALDHTFALVDSFETGNGYVPDTHDLLFLPNGHFLLMAYDPQPVRMDLVVPGGDPEAVVVGLIIQELDADRNVVFQWRSWDHFEITDAVNVNLTASNVDYIHGNSLDVMPDGNLLLCSRHINEITKIDGQTGEIIWQMGAHSRNNQFTFVNDPRGFSYQHDARWLPNGHMTVFDNGNFLNPLYSRMVEYAVDEVNKVATEVMEYSHTPSIFTSFMGSARRLPSGKTLIGWGGGVSPTKLTELNPDGSVSLELGGSSNSLSYRAIRSPWRGGLLVTDETLDCGIANPGQTVVRTLPVRNGSSHEVTIGCTVSTDPQFVVTTPLPLTLAAGAEVMLDVAFTPSAIGVRSGKIYLRAPNATQFVAQDVTVTGIGKPIAMPFEFTPRTLNLASHGLWVTGFLEPASPFATSQIDISSIRLNGTVPVDPAAPTALGDHDGNGVTDLMVKFNRAAVDLTVSEGDMVPVNVTGTVDELPFLGTDYIQVRRAVVSSPPAGSRLTAGSVTQVQWQTPGGLAFESVALLYSHDGGSTWSLIAHGEPNTGSYDWTVPHVGTDLAKVAVVLVEAADETGYIVDGVLGVSDAFSIDALLGVGEPGPTQFALRSVMPNPSQHELRVSFSLRDSKPATLALFDVSGRQLAEHRVDGMGPGWHTAVLGGGSNLPAGIYVIRLTQDGRSLTTRAALIR